MSDAREASVASNVRPGSLRFSANYECGDRKLEELSIEQDRMMACLKKRKKQWCKERHVLSLERIPRSFFSTESRVRLHGFLRHKIRQQPAVVALPTSSEVDMDSAKAKEREVVNLSNSPMVRRKRPAGDPMKDAYENVTITPRESTGRPGSPHRFFQASFTVSVAQKGPIEQPRVVEESALVPQCINEVVVHQHANGLCIVTAGKPTSNVKNIHFLIKEAPESSAGERRKCLSKLLSGRNIADAQGLTMPNTFLAQLEMENGETQLIPAGVWGTVLELNPQLTPDLLRGDPLLDGYIAVILPVGSFPPRFRNGEATDGNAQIKLLQPTTVDPKEVNDLEP